MNRLFLVLASFSCGFLLAFSLLSTPNGTQSSVEGLAPAKVLSEKREDMPPSAQSDQSESGLLRFRISELEAELASLKGSQGLVADRTAILKANIDKAMIKLRQGDADGAVAILNKARNDAKTKEELAQIIDALVDVERAKYNYLMADGNHLHGALWALFEIHKLNPSEANTNDALAVAREIYSQAQDRIQQNNLLGASDYLNMLEHVSKMMDFSLIVDDGAAKSSDDFAYMAGKVENSENFFPAIQERARLNIDSQDEFVRSLVFWDYNTMAEIRGQNAMYDEVFKEEFTLAAVSHLSYLEKLNKTGELRSRMDFIQYTYPDIAKDERVRRFYQ